MTEKMCDWFLISTQFRARCKGWTFRPRLARRSLCLTNSSLLAFSLATSLLEHTVSQSSKIFFFVLSWRFFSKTKACVLISESSSGRLEIHFSLFVTGYNPSLMDGSGPAMGIEVSAVVKLLLLFTMFSPLRLRQAIRVSRSWTSAASCPAWSQSLFGRLIGFPSRTR